jgi:hypothetical protein
MSRQRANFLKADLYHNVSKCMNRGILVVLLFAWLTATAMTQQQLLNPSSAPQQLEQARTHHDVTIQEGINQQQDHESQNHLGRLQQQFSCVYTTQLTQKRKRWHDGRLIVHIGRAILHDADPAVGTGDPVLDAIELVGHQYDSILKQKEVRLQTEKHIIEIQGMWMSTNVIPAGATRSTLKPVRSTGMNNVLATKFRKVTVGEFIPAPQEINSHLHQPAWRRRNRPLQPGELQQRHFGNRQVLPQTSSGGHAVAPACDNIHPHNATVTWNQPKPSAAVRPLHPTRWNHNQCTQQFSSNPRQSWNPSHPHSLEGQPSVESRNPTSSQPLGNTTTNPTVAQRRPHSSDMVNPTDLQLLSPDLANTHAVFVEKENDHQFVANAFNPGSFYGEEGDDEGMTQNGAPDPFDWDTDNEHSVHSSKNESTAAPEHDEDSRNKNSYADSKSDVDIPHGANSSLSTLELLQLFGTDNSAITDERGGVSSHAYGLDDDTIRKNDLQSGFRFALPPASDSSSDENDD